jgi:hypothetical protein
LCVESKMPELIYACDLPKYGIRYSPAYLSRLIAAGKFPKPGRTGDAKNSRYVWTEDQILAFRDAIIARRTAA